MQTPFTSFMPTVQRSQPQALPVIACRPLGPAKGDETGSPNPIALVAIVRDYNAVNTGVTFPRCRLISRKSPQPVVFIYILIARC